MPDNWSVDSIVDETYRSKFVDVPNIIAEWLGDHGGVAGKDVLDFGCGEATMALGMALRHGVRRVVGMDVYEESTLALPFREGTRALPQAKVQLGLHELPQNFETISVAPGTPIESLGTFDIIYSWSVLEHVQQDMILDCLTQMRRALRPGGLMFLQTTPLFYSAHGSHFKQWLPEPWIHLTLQHSLLFAALREKLQSEEMFAKWSALYETLNKVTEPQLMRAIGEAGFEIIREHRTFDEFPIPRGLGEIFNEQVLRTNQLAFLAKLA
jgi:2-polyprenyl-3-methyl-5-hydroxy-6-metoxy-1,4-benzoquinol methylase